MHTVAELVPEYSQMYIEIESRLEAIVEDLKSLPPASYEIARDALDRTIGCLSPDEADDMARVIKEGLRVGQ